MSDIRNLEAEKRWTDALAVLRRRWRTLLATFVGFVTVAGVLSARMPRVYRATARIVIGVGNPGGWIADRASPIEGYLLERRSFETQLEVLRSEPVALRAAERLGWIDRESGDAERSRAAERVRASLAVAHLRDTRVVLVHGLASSASEAQAIANAVAEAYIAYTREQEEALRQRSVAWLTREIQRLREELRDSEGRLVDYLAQAQLDPTAGGEAVGDPSGSDTPLQAEIDAAQLELARLLRRYRDRHPKVVEARARLAVLERRLARERERRAERERRLIQYRLLKRDAELDQQMYQVLLKKLKEADLSAGAVRADIRILERAKAPAAPVAPRRLRQLAIAAILGLCAAIGLAYAVDALDRSVATPDEVAAVLGLSTLASITRFEGAGDPALAASSAGSLAGESFRALRTNLRFSDVDRPRRVVLVTSTGPEEGKSTVLSNLGLSLAAAGSRTLLVDTDLRRPSLHRFFAVAKSPGLADWLAGDADPESVVRSTGHEGLDLLPCGTLPPNPAELIESARLQQLLAQMRERYDTVLLDSPPAGGLVDASLLAGFCDGVLFVVEPRRFDARMLRSALRQLERGKARLYGVVLNKTPRDERQALYRYYSNVTASPAAPSEKPARAQEGSA